MELEEGAELTEEEVAEWAQDVLNNRYSCAGKIVDEDQVPEDQR